TELAHKIPNTGAFNWVTPNGYFPLCRVIVTLYWKPGANATYGTDDEDEEVDEDGDAIFGMGISEDPVAIEEPLAVRLKAAGATVVDGDALIRWETNFEEGVSGFNVVRSDAEEGTYTNVTRDLIAARGGPAGASYEYRDPSIRPNLTYWYKLVEVTPDGDAMQFGPYSVSFKVTNSLAQNVPNPFNPLTTIKYSIAEDIDVSLVVYDVSGRRVRTLVSDHQRADVYKVVWDGVNDQGGRVASGMYFYKLVAGKYVQTRKMMLLK
ncbi:MAG TPA: FlgD immunoglobulin-like domain containing protein, partial [Candidatus Krumholzibacteria bacterium]|nr:FlgD immunoglobulin-like domain containing protein [Candidatus Krumholzibacteria bacterium]